MSDQTQRDAQAREEAPTNGIKGLRHWRHDLLAGLVVSLVSLPLSSGIAIASGAPPIYGIISSIIAGLLFPLVGGSFVTISGPAAGLAPALVAVMVSLGGAGDADHVGAGYHMLLVVICLAGLLQIVMARLKLARFGSIFPASAVEGMLGAIGVLILIKAMPLFLGYVEPTHAHGFLEYVAALPRWWEGGDNQALLVAVATLVTMLAANSRAARRFALFQKAPPHIFGVIVGVGLSMALGLGAADPRFLIEVPANPLEGLSLPDFKGLASHSELWWAATVGVLTLMMIDGVESLATAQAIDRIDPFKRKSDPDKVLMAMGLSNMVSSLLGGLTVIPGGVKSKTCIEAGGRTLWANFANALFLLGFLFVAPALVSLLPKATLGAILVYTGWKMIHPSIARHLAAVGWEQVLVYFITIVVTLLTDILVGVLAGTLAKLIFLVPLSWMGHKALRDGTTLWGSARELFQDPVKEEITQEGKVTLRVHKPVVCFNAYKLSARLDKLQAEGKQACVEFLPSATVIDHTSREALHRMEDNNPAALVVTGVEKLYSLSAHHQAVRVRFQLSE